MKSSEMSMPTEQHPTVPKRELADRSASALLYALKRRDFRHKHIGAFPVACRTCSSASQVHASSHIEPDRIR